MNQSHLSSHKIAYKATNLYSPPEVRQQYLDSIVRKLMRAGLASVVVEDHRKEMLSLKDVCESVDGCQCADIELVFGVREDLTHEELMEAHTTLGHYANRLGLHFSSQGGDIPGYIMLQNYQRRAEKLQLRPDSKWITFTFSNKEQP